MNDHELRDLLAVGDRPVEPPEDVAARVRAAIAAELDRTPLRRGQAPEIPIEIGADGERPTHAGGPRAPWWLAAAAVVLVVAGVVGIALRPSDDGPSPTVVPVSEPAVVEPPAYLRACLDLRTAGRPDDRRWQDVIAELDPESEEGRSYLDGLAVALAALADTPTAASLAPQLDAASAIAGDDNPDLAVLAAALDALAQELPTLAGSRCL